MTLPNFLVVGAAKSGTTAFCKFLGAHPDIFLCSYKEPHFFVIEKPFGRTTRTLEEYESLFAGSDPFPYRGEGSTGYLYHPEAVDRIKALLGTCKIFILLRNPVERAYSMYWHNVRDGKDKLSFEDALLAEATRIQNRWEISYHYTNLCFVSDAIQRYLQAFGKQNVSILFADDMKNNQSRFMMHAFEFLSLPDIDVQTTTRYNPSGAPRLKWLNTLLNSGSSPLKYPAKLVPRSQALALRNFVNILNLKPYEDMNPDTKQSLVQKFEKEISRLEEVTGRDLTHWKK